MHSLQILPVTLFTLFKIRLSVIQTLSPVIAFFCSTQHILYYMLSYLFVPYAHTESSHFSAFHLFLLLLLLLGGQVYFHRNVNSDCSLAV